MKKGDKVIIKHNKNICTVLSVHRHGVEVTSELWLGTSFMRYEEIDLDENDPVSKIFGGIIPDDLLRLIEFGTGDNNQSNNMKSEIKEEMLKGISPYSLVAKEILLINTGHAHGLMNHTHYLSMKDFALFILSELKSTMLDYYNSPEFSVVYKDNQIKFKQVEDKLNNMFK